MRTLRRIASGILVCISVGLLLAGARALIGGMNAATHRSQRGLSDTSGQIQAWAIGFLASGIIVGVIAVIASPVKKKDEPKAVDGGCV